MKKRNNENAAALLSEEHTKAESSAERITNAPADDVDEVNRALSRALSADSAEEPPADPDSVFTVETADVPPAEQETPCGDVPEIEQPLSPREDPPAKEAKEPKEKKESPAAAVLRITLPLTVICAVVALMLAVVNLLTADIIAQNTAREKENAVRAIFTKAQTILPLSSEEGTEVYLAVSGTEILGSCVSLSENGFGGAISMIVGMDCSGSVCGVQIVSMSETPGFGTRAKNDSFLVGFRGSDPFVIGENFDALSGASITSKAVVAGVNRAMNARPDLQAEAAERGLTLAEAAAAPDAPVIPPEESAPSTPSASTQSPAAAETTSAETNSAVALPSPPDTMPAEEDTVTRGQMNLAAVMPTTIIAARSASYNRVTVVSAETVYAEETEDPAEPETVETDLPVTEPAETEPAVTEPVETEPAVTEPAVTEPAVTEPVETEPAVTEPVETEPAVTEPAVTEPAVTEPAVTEPAVTEPVETEPAVTEPAVTEPAETRPVASGV